MVGINDDHEQIQMSIYVRDNYLYFKNFAPLNKRMQFTLSDLSGREVIVLNENSFNDPIDVQSLAPGIYVVNIYSDDHFFKGKIFLN
jgi:hypothetical protein